MINKIIQLSQHYLKKDDIQEAFGEGSASAIKSTIDSKVDKVDGKGLSTNDYTTAEKNKLNGIDSNANNYTHPSTHSSTIITESSALNNIGTSANANQHTINAAINTEIGTLKNIKVVEIVSSKPTASASTMNKLYIVSENGKVNVYYTVQSGSNYSLKKMDTDILDEFSIDWSEVNNKPSTFSPTSHQHGSIQNNGTLNSDTSTVSKVVVTDSSNNIKTISKIPSANVTHQDISGKVNKSDIQDNLSSDASDKPLSAKQGAALQTQINNIATNTSLSTHNHDSSYLSKTGNDTSSGYITASGFKVSGKSNFLKADGTTADANNYTHPNSGVTAGTHVNSNQTPSFNNTFNIPKITYDAQGHITGMTSATVKIPALPTSSTSTAGIIKIGTTASDAAAGNHTHSEYLTSHQSLSNYVTTGDSRLSNARVPVFTDIPASSSATKDLNSYVTGGFYYCDADGEAPYISNQPWTSGQKAFFMLVETWGTTSNYVKQTLTYYTTGQTYVRTKTGSGGWKSWIEMTKDTNTTYTAGTGLTLSSGAFSLTDASNYIKKSSTVGYIKNDGTIGTPTNTTYSVATTSANGLMSSTDKTKLDGVATGANNYSHPSYTARTGVPTGNSTLSFGGTFKVSQPTSDATGHVTALNERTYTLPSLPSSMTPSAHNQASSTITEATALGNIGTSANATQATINSKINEKIGTLSSIKALEIVTSLPTASASTMNKLYIISENSKVNVYYTTVSGSTYSWHKMDADILDELSIAWNDITGKPSTFTPSSHTHTKSQVTDFPTLATVATSGSYNDLSNKPTIPSAYSHPNSFTALTSGLYKITTNTNGHVTAGTAVTSADIANLGVAITDNNTTYSAGTGLSLASNAFSVNYGTTDTTACIGNDSRLSDARTPKFNQIIATASNTQDLNNYKTGGFYYCSSDANNAPYINNQPLTTNQKSFFLLVETWGTTSTYVKQTLTYYTTNITYTRTCANGTWSSWVALSKDGHTHNYISTAAGSVGASNLASNAVEEAKIKNGAVTNAKIASNAAIDFSKLNITKANITGLGIPAQDTTYSGATGTSALGLVKITDSYTTKNGVAAANSVAASAKAVNDVYTIFSGTGTTKNAHSHGNIREDGTITANFTDPEHVVVTTSNNVVAKTDISNVIEKAYPVGSIYMNATDSTDPEELLGFGVWMQIGQGRVLLGQGTAPEDNSMAYALGATGGSKNAIVVEHSHTFSKGGAAICVGVDSNQSTFNNGFASGSSHWNNVNTSNSSIASKGSSGTNKNMPPYLVVFMWQRVS